MRYLHAVSLRSDPARPADRHPFALPAIRSLETLTFATPVTIFVGENGTGKSTLLEAIAVAAGMNASGGSMNFAPREDEEPVELAGHLRLVRDAKRPADTFFLRAETFYNVASTVRALGVTGYGDRDLHERSHGEAFLTLLAERFRGRGLYLLDEPEAALSPARQLAALVRLHDLVGLDSQIIMATHSPILMACPGATILRFDDDGPVRPVALEDTDHFRLTRDFLAAPERMLRALLDAS